MNKYDTSIELNKKSSLTYTISKIAAGSTVLEFGSATGYMTRYLKEEKGCRVSIIEIDREAYNIALNYAEDGICCDAERMEWLDYFKGRKFDYITFSDVLEHLREPDKVLRASRNLLCDGGRIITSIPNIGHNAVLIDLYNNKFQYRKTGILDNTHLRFFTYGSMKELFRGCGLKVVDEDAVEFDLNYVGFDNTRSDVPENFWREIEDREYGFVNQFLFVLSSNVDGEAEKYRDKRKLESALYYKKDENEAKFSEENKIIAELVLGDGDFQVDYDITELNVSAVRIEPFERFCVIEKMEASIGEKSVAMTPAGGFEIKTGGRGFLTDIPKYEAFISGSGILHVCGKIRNIELSDISMYVLANNEQHLQEISALEAENGRLNQVIDEKLDIIRCLGDEKDDILKEMEQLCQNNGSLNQEIVRLNGEMEKACRDNGSLNQEIVRLNGEMEKACRDNETLNQEIVRLNDDCVILGQEIRQQEERIGKSTLMLAEKDARIEEILNSLPKWRRKKFL